MYGVNADLFLVAAARSLCRRFLNQLPTWVGERPVLSASCRLRPGLGYGSCRYDSRNRLRVRSLKQCDAVCPAVIVTDDVDGPVPPSTSFQMVVGVGGCLRTAAPSGRAGLDVASASRWRASSHKDCNLYRDTGYTKCIANCNKCYIWQMTHASHCQ